MSEQSNPDSHYKKEVKIARRLLPYLEVEWLDPEEKSKIENLGQFYITLIIKKVLEEEKLSGKIISKEKYGQLIAKWAIHIKSHNQGQILPPSNQN